MELASNLCGDDKRAEKGKGVEKSREKKNIARKEGRENLRVVVRWEYNFEQRV